MTGLFFNLTWHFDPEGLKVNQNHFKMLIDKLPYGIYSLIEIPASE